MSTVRITQATVMSRQTRPRSRRIQITRSWCCMVIVTEDLSACSWHLRIPFLPTRKHPTSGVCCLHWAMKIPTDDVTTFVLCIRRHAHFIYNINKKKTSNMRNNFIQAIAEYVQSFSFDPPPEDCRMENLENLFVKMLSAYGGEDSNTLATITLRLSENHVHLMRGDSLRRMRKKKTREHRR